MRRSLRNSSWIWFGTSIGLHVVLVSAIWNLEVEEKSDRPAAVERVVISLLASPEPAPIVDVPPLIESPPPVSAPPPPETPHDLPKPVPVDVPSTRPPSVPISSPLPTRPPSNSNTNEIRAAVDPAAQQTPDRAAASVANPAESTEAELPNDPMPDYVREVRSRIETHKRYPALARRRSEEGLALARLYISNDGRVEDLEIAGAVPLSLRRATREAIENATPFPMPPRGAVVIEVPIRWRVVD